MKTIYVADDGKKFDNLKDCEKYESSLIEEPIEEINMEPLIKMVKEYKDYCYSDAGCDDKDTEWKDYIFETAITCVYPKFFD